MSNKTKQLFKDKPVTKKEMVNYIGPIFEELKTDNRRLETKVEKMLDSTTRELKVMMEASETKVLSALETFVAVSAKGEDVQRHDERITCLEDEVAVLKAAVKQ